MRVLSEDRSISAQPVATLGGSTIRSFRKNRICQEPGCGTVLSIYNGDKYCCRHVPRRTVRVRGRA